MKWLLNIGILYAIILCMLLSCKEKLNCRDIPTRFSSTEDAIKFIKSRSFRTSDSIVIPVSTFMTSAKFYSCDGKSGYFFYTRKYGNEYFYSKVPVDLWTRFKFSEIKDSFFYKNIDGRFTSIIIYQDDPLHPTNLPR